jgi:hypothetical protein
MKEICKCGHDKHRHADASMALTNPALWGVSKCENGFCGCKTFSLDEDNPENETVVNYLNTEWPCRHAIRRLDENLNHVCAVCGELQQKAIAI